MNWHGSTHLSKSYSSCPAFHLHYTACLGPKGRRIDVITVCFEDPARIPDVASREIWSPRGSSDGFLKGCGQIGLTMLVQRLVNFVTGLFSFIQGMAFGLIGHEPNHWAVGSNPSVPDFKTGLINENRLYLD
jgi:hypothetical protein